MGVAEAAYSAGDVAAARRLALDEGDLRLAGVCSLELGDVDDAVRLLQQAAVADATAVVDLAHVLHRTGRTHEAIDALRSSPTPHDDAVLAALVAIGEAGGRVEHACDAAATLATRRPDEVRTVLDHAELGLVCERYDEAAAAFARLRAIDRDDGHRTFASQGQAEALARAGRWRDALDAALEATRTDRGQLTTDLLACVNARVFGDGGRLAPTWESLTAELAVVRQAHRRYHAEAL